MKIKDQPKATRRQLLARVAELGCTMDEESNRMFYVDSPKGKKFAGTSTHALGYLFRNNASQSWKPQAYYDALKDLEMGLEDCDDPECDTCFDLCDCNDLECPMNHPNRKSDV